MRLTELLQGLLVDIGVLVGVEGTATDEGYWGTALRSDRLGGGRDES
jgi:hypothetical protein